MKRIIPCLDLKNGRVVKGTRFEGLREAGDPLVLAKFYEEAGADELVLLDITASIDGRDTLLDVVAKIAKELSIPLTVGGGVRTLADIRRLLSVGVDKVAINSAALMRPELIREAAEQFGSQCIVLAIDVKNGEVYSHAGTRATGRNALEWAMLGQKLGAGELLATSIDRDGTKEGYDLKWIAEASRTLSIPIIASGGVGKWEDIRDVFLDGKADAALAASLFHFGICSIGELKQKLKNQNIQVRL